MWVRYSDRYALLTSFKNMDEFTFEDNRVNGNVAVQDKEKTFLIIYHGIK